MVLLVKNLVRQISNLFYLLYSSVCASIDLYRLTFGEFANDRLPLDSRVGNQTDATCVCI